MTAARGVEADAVVGGSSLTGLLVDDEEECKDWEEALERRDRLAKALDVFSRARAAKE